MIYFVLSISFSLSPHSVVVLSYLLLLLLLSRPRSSSWHMCARLFIGFYMHSRATKTSRTGNGGLAKIKRKRMQHSWACFYMWFRCVWTLTILLHRKHYSIWSVLDSFWAGLVWFALQSYLLIVMCLCLYAPNGLKPWT